MAVLITMFYMAGAIKTTTPGKLGGGKLTYLISWVKRKLHYCHFQKLKMTSMLFIV